ncbi:hypothetical protein [Kangiella marina]|uniref:Uncharacterized protein n=1 Tax=Kangiella marina TaxID=1079178 RepID=A0ABP8IPC3_9GAMM
MFESIAMICYLSMVQPQEIQQPLFDPKEVALGVYTGSNGGEPEEDPEEKERN